MKYFLLLCLCALFLVVGCRSPYYSETLTKIPDYPTLERTYDTSARLAVYKHLDFTDRLILRLKNEGFTVLDDTAYHQADYQGPDKILALLSYTRDRLYYNDETYLYARILVSVRPPFQQAGRNPPAINEGTRYFQAHARRNFGDNEEMTEAHFLQVREDALDNLMRNPAFREALER